MADDLLTLAELATINDQAVADIDVSDIFNLAPFLAALAATTASNGTTHKYLKETGAPVVGFRDANDGRDHDVSEDTLVTVTLKILDATFKVDQALADEYKDGPAAWISREARRHLRQAFREAEEQIINGTGNDADGFTGLADALDQLADAMVLGNGGSSACTSVYMLRTDNDLSHVTSVLGRSGNISIGTTFQDMVAGSSTGTFPAYVTPITAWLGLQIGSAKSVARLANIDDGSNKLDDDALSLLYELFPAEIEPNLIVLNKRSRRQLQQSRTATGPTGAPAPWPTEWEGIPIVQTSSIGVAETAVT